MNIKDKVIEISKLLDELDSYSEELPNRLSVLDNKRNDLMHIIELIPLNSSQRWRIVKVIKDVELERRQIKNEMELIKVLRDQQNKLLNKGYRPFLLNDIGKAYKIQNNRQYSYRGYTEEEIKELIGV